MFCKNCGFKLDDDSKFCPSCGTQITVGEGQVPPPPVITPPVVKKNKDVLTTVSLVLAILASFFSLGMVLNMFGSDWAPLLVVLGFLFLLPAFIISIIAFVKALVAFKKDHEKTKAFTKRIVAFCLSAVLPCMVLLITVVFGNSIRYNRAVEYYEQGHYGDAYTIFSDLGDYKDSVAQAKESRYQSGIALAKGKEWDASTNIFKELASEDYRASKELYLYCDAKNKMNTYMDSAVTILKAKLKDPSSFQNLGNTCSYSFSQKGIVLNMQIDGTLKYSATNSFGGRVTDKYTYQKEVLLSGHSFTPIEARKILSMGIAQIAADYDR